MSARKEVKYKGIRYDDIDWSQSIHSLGTHCPECGNDGAEGHGSSCYYLWDMMESPRGRIFLRDMIKEAVEKEQKLGLR